MLQKQIALEAIKKQEIEDNFAKAFQEAIRIYKKHNGNLSGIDVSEFKLTLVNILVKNNHWDSIQFAMGQLLKAGEDESSQIAFLQLSQEMIESKLAEIQN